MNIYVRIRCDGIHLWTFDIFNDPSENGRCWMKLYDLSTGQVFLEDRRSPRQLPTVIDGEPITLKEDQHRGNIHVHTLRYIHLSSTPDRRRVCQVLWNHFIFYGLLKMNFETLNSNVNDVNTVFRDLLLDSSCYEH